MDLLNKEIFSQQPLTRQASVDTKNVGHSKRIEEIQK